MPKIFVTVNRFVDDYVSDPRDIGLVIEAIEHGQLDRVKLMIPKDVSPSDKSKALKIPIIDIARYYANKKCNNPAYIEIFNYIHGVEIGKDDDLVNEISKS